MLPPVFCPTFPAQLPCYTTHPAPLVQMRLPDRMRPGLHPTVPARRETVLCCSRPRYNGGQGPAHGRMQSGPPHAVLVRAASSLYYTRLRSDRYHIQGLDYMMLERLRTFVTLPVRCLDYTTHLPEMNRASAHDRNSEGLRESGVNRAGRWLYQTRTWRFVVPV